MRKLPSFLFCLQENKDVTICGKSSGDKEHTFLKYTDLFLNQIYTK